MTTDDRSKLPIPSLPVDLMVVLAGWLVLYVPAYLWAFEGIWQTDDQGHGPMILAVCAWLFWRVRDSVASLPAERSWIFGGLLLGFGLLSYVFGRVFAFPIFTFGSQIPVAAGLLLLFKGTAGVRLAWFALLFLIFMVPLPGSLVDASTQSLKQWISWIVTELLHGVGLPISRAGVTITVGQYQLLVADACSGMHSMFSLTALGVLYLYVMQRPGVLHNALLIAMILPTAFLANVVRVMILILVTYTFGEEAGRGFLHGFAGMAMLVASLLILFAVDGLLSRLLPARGRAPVRIGGEVRL